MLVVTILRKVHKTLTFYCAIHNHQTLVVWLVYIELYKGTSEGIYKWGMLKRDKHLTGKFKCIKYFRVACKGSGISIGAGKGK